MAEKSLFNPEMMKYLTNPKSYTLKKWFADILKNNYTQHNDLIIERVSAGLTTDRDLEDFGKLMIQIYESGYKKCLSDYESKFKEMGLDVKLIENRREI